jgi:hypothetical protein
VSDAPVNRMLLLAATSVAMLTGFVVVALVAVPVQGDRDQLPAVWGLLLLPVPALFATAAFWLVTSGFGGRRVLAAAAVLFGGVGATIVGAGFGGLYLVIAPLATGAVAVAAAQLLRPS